MRRRHWDQVWRGGGDRKTLGDNFHTPPGLTSLFPEFGGRGSGLGGGPVLSFSKQINYIAIALPTCARARIVNSIISFIRAARPERAR